MLELLKAPALRVRLSGGVCYNCQLLRLLGDAHVFAVFADGGFLHRFYNFPCHWVSAKGAAEQKNVRLWSVDGIV
jgi:hypothetical protein